MTALENLSIKWSNCCSIVWSVIFAGTNFHSLGPNPGFCDACGFNFVAIHDVCESGNSVSTSWTARDMKIFTNSSLVMKM